MRYFPQKIEKKRQKKWLADKIYEPNFSAAKKPFYNLMMFPYPSAEGLHVGNMYAFTGADIYGRFKRMQGYDVFEPIGLDGFGIHSENYAMKIGRHPRDRAKISEKNFYRQLSEIGNGFAWRERLETYDPEYYRWTQWIFVQMFKRGLAYRKKQAVNWCSSCKTVLADEQVVSGECERCSAKVIKKELEQWFFKITDYAERLLQNLEKLDWSERVKIAQKNWIGKSEGALIDFRIKTQEKLNFVLLHGKGGSPDRDFIPWLKSELEKSGFSVQAPNLPNTNEPNDIEQTNYALKHCKFDEQTIVIGHSFGGIVALRLIERGINLRKVILVGTPSNPCFLDEKKRPTIAAAINRGFDFSAIKKNVKEFALLYDEKDHVVPVEHGEVFAKALDVSIKTAVGRSSHFTAEVEPEVLRLCIPSVKVFTTRPDTLFGATYLTLSPEHALLRELRTKNLELSNLKEIEKYIKMARAKSDEERIFEGKNPPSPEDSDGRRKTGVELKGLKAINPANGEEIPVWVADYVLGGVGTGAIMAVPAHDERDWEFAQRYKLPVKEAVEPLFVKTDDIDGVRPGLPLKERDAVVAVVKHWAEDKYLCLKWKKTDWRGFVIGGIDKDENVIGAAIREIREETGYTSAKFIRSLGGTIHARFYHAVKNENRWAHFHGLYFELTDGKKLEIADEEKQIHDIAWVDKQEVDRFLGWVTDMHLIWHRASNPDDFPGRSGIHESSRVNEEGILVNSGTFSGMDSEKAKWEITKFVGGERKIQYRLRDWLISRQRYWGPPIPMIFCDNCKESISGMGSPTSRGSRTSEDLNRGEIDNLGWHAVPEKDLPVKLPYVKDFRPTGTDKSPLATVEKFYKVRCPKCKSWARRETDVSDTFLDSSWYYIAYLMKFGNWSVLGRAWAGPGKLETGNSALAKLTRQWLPVNMYIGGAEHSVLHLLYSRFIAMAFKDWGLTHFEEPFTKFRAHGLLIKNGAKMSKSRGNVVNPDEYIKAYGADALRMYLMFLGPFEQGGDFRDDGIRGITRFLERTWKFILSTNYESAANIRIRKFAKNSLFVDKILHKTIKKVTEDIENLQYNTAISALMMLLNKFEKNQASITQEHILMFLRLLAPFAPHITEEIYSTIRVNPRLDPRKSASIHLEKWPEYNPKLIQDDTFELVVQINGKVRDKFEAPIDISEQEATDLTLSRERVKSIVGTLKPRKVIFIPRRLINIVI